MMKHWNKILNKRRPASVFVQLSETHILLRITSRPRAQSPIITRIEPILQAPPTPPAVLHTNASHVQHTLQRVTDDPQPQRHVRLLIPADDQHTRRHSHEREVPYDVENDYGLGVRPVTLALLELLRRSLPHQHRRLPHHPAAARSPQETRGVPEALPAHGSASRRTRTVVVVWGCEKRRRINDVIG